ncbi:MAG: ATP-binding protein [Pararhizobium sp.]
MSNAHDEGQEPVSDHLVDGSGSNQPEADVNTVTDASRAPPHQESTKAPSNEQSTGPREPSALYEMLQHPLLMRNVVLPTTAVAEVITKVRGAAMLREHSICFSGPSGSGKSQALRGVAIELPKHFPDVSIFTHNILNQPVNSTRAFFKHFLVTTRGGLTTGETYDLRYWLANRLLDEALQSKLKLVVMLVDESQQMTLEDFNFLKDIGNHLEFYNAHILVVMMAEEPSFQEVVSMLSHTDRKGISCRPRWPG